MKQKVNHVTEDSLTIYKDDAFHTYNIKEMIQTNSARYMIHKSREGGIIDDESDGYLKLGFDLKFDKREIIKFGITSMAYQGHNVDLTKEEYNRLNQFSLNLLNNLIKYKREIPR